MNYKEILKEKYKDKLRKAKSFLYNGNDNPSVRLEIELITQFLISISNIEKEDFK